MQSKTQKVVDSNYLRSPKLQDYLREKRTNYVVLTDYAAMEAFKRNPLYTLRRSTEILSNYPAQVIVLKSTTTVCGLRGRQAGLRRRMIDEGQTREFAAWCKALKKTEQHGRREFERHILALGREADAHIMQVQADTSSMPRLLADLAKYYGPDEVARIRRYEFTDELLSKLTRLIITTSGTLFRGHPNATRLRDITEVPNLFIFRFALMWHMLALRWLHFGGAESAKPETLRNDLIDVSFATYATFFDGLLSRDDKPNSIFTEGSHMLNALTSAVQKGAAAHRW